MTKSKHVLIERSKCLNILRMLVLSSGGLYFGYFAAIMNPLAKPMLEGVLEYSAEIDGDILNTYYGMVNFLFGAGAFVGVFSAGELAKYLGRRPILYAGEIIALLNIVPSVIKGTSSLMMSRFLSGLVSGIHLSIYSIILSELLPNKLAGIGGSLGNFFLTIGMMLSYISQNILSYEEIVEYWRVLLVYPLIFSVIRLTLFVFLFKTDTPEYIFKKTQRSHQKKNAVGVVSYPKQVSASKEAPIQLKKSNTVELELSEREVAQMPRKFKSVNNSPTNRSSPYQRVLDRPQASTRALMPPVSEIKEEEVDHRHAAQHLATETLETENAECIKPVEVEKSSVDKKVNDLHSAGIHHIIEAYEQIYEPWSASVIATRNVSFWQATQTQNNKDVTLKHMFGKMYRRQLFSGIFVSMALQLSGINFFFYYSTALFDQIANQGKMITLVVGISNIVGALMGAPMIHKLGRKSNLIIGCTLQAMGMLLLAVGYSIEKIALLIIGTVLYMAGFSIGFGGTQTAYVSEILPPSGIGLSFSIQWLLDTLTGLTIPFFIVWVGPLAMIIFFLVFNLIALLTIVVTCVETKNKSPEEVFNEFNRSIFHLC